MYRNVILLLVLFAIVSCSMKDKPTPDPTLWISVIPESAAITVNGTQQLAATISPGDATNKTVTWSSSAESVASVSTGGLVTGIAVGSAIITARPQADHNTASCKIAVIGASTAVNANDFLNSIGANSAISRRGESLQNTINSTKYLGIRWYRSGYESGIPIQDLIELHNQTGVRFSYGLLSGGTDITRLINGAKQLAAIGALLAFEGPNEPNNWGITYLGEAGGGSSNTWLPVAKLQRDLYSSVKSDPIVKDYPVWALTETGAEKDNVGLQFITIPQGAETLMPDGTKFADFANAHNYIYHPGFSGVNDNQVWIAADPTSACKVDGLYGNYGLTWSKKYAGYSESDLIKLPKVTTETGVRVGDVSGAITEEIQANNYLAVYLDQFKRGWSNTAIYLLRDRTDESGNQQFGFYKPDYTPRKSAIYLHNLTTILDDSISMPNPGKLNYFIQDQPVTTHDLLLQKSNGKFELVVWSERVKGSENVTVQLGRTFTTVKVFDPTVGISVIQILNNVSSVTLPMSDHPMIIEL